MSRPLVTIAIATKESEETVESLLRCALAQDYPKDAVEIVVADGMSMDATREVVLRVAGEDPRIRLIDNPHRTRAGALNAILAQSRGELIVPMDPGGDYARTHVGKCVDALAASPADHDGSTLAIVPRSTGRTLVQRALSAVQSTKLAFAEGAELARGSEPALLGAVRRRVFERVGLFDPGARCEEDVELSRRITRAGGALTVRRDIVVHRADASSFKDLFRRHYQLGRTRARRTIKDRRVASIRELGPLAIVSVGGALAATASIQPLTPPRCGRVRARHGRGGRARRPSRGSDHDPDRVGSLPRHACRSWRGLRCGPRSLGDPARLEGCTGDRVNARRGPGFARVDGGGNFRRGARSSLSMRAGTAWEEHTAVIPYVAVEADRRIESDTDGASLVVEAKLSWGGSVLAVTHAAPKAHGALRVRDLDLPMRSELDLVVARRVHGQLVLVLPSGEVVPSGCQMTLRLGAALLRVALVPAETSTLPRSQSDGRVAKGVALGAVIHGAVLAIAILGRAPIGEQEAASQAAMSGYLAAIEARSELADATQAQAAQAPSEVGREKSDALSSGKKRDEGAAGNPARVTEGGLAARTRGVDRFRGHPGAEKPETFGMIALLTSTKDGDHAGSSAFADFEGPGAMGSIFGAKIDDAPGFGGLGLSGPGEGGGGKGAGVPLAGIGLGNMLSGTCDAKCLGMRGGLSAHGVSTRGSHAVRSPSLRCGVELDTKGVAHETCATQVSGRLPPEAIQRVVRQSFGRLRACYEAGLQRDPGLEGRIAVKFVIDREGAVSMASVADRDLPDAEVAACVARAYTAMSFPKPEGGIVTVVYPVVFGS